MIDLPKNRPPRLLTLAPGKSWLILLLLQVTACSAWLSNAKILRVATPTTTIHHHQFRPRIRSPAMHRSTTMLSNRSVARFARNSLNEKRRSSLYALQQQNGQKNKRLTDRNDWSSILRAKNPWRSQRLRRLIGCGALLCLATFLLAPSSALASSISSKAASTLAAETLVEPTLAATADSAVATAATTTANAAWACLEAPVPVGVELKLMKRLLFASLLGGCVGKERSSTHKHSAGVRTMALVALGACAFTICSSIGFSHLGNAKCDPSRMASNVASGVGFVGAGVITTSANGSDSRQSMVHGLTTATAVCGEYCGTFCRNDCRCFCIL